VSIFNGITTTWSYNSTDDITKPLAIIFYQTLMQHTIEDDVGKNLNITLGTFNFKAPIEVVDVYTLLFRFDNSEYWVDSFNVSTSFSSTTIASRSASSTPTSAISPHTITMIQMSSHTASITSVWNSSSTEAQSSVHATGLPHGLGKGAVAGVAIGVIVAVAALVGCCIFLYRRVRKRSYLSTQEAAASSLDKGSAKRASEIDGKPVIVFELPGNHAANSSHELPE
jgi:hypothetical protein